jgi:hypothetical protein
MAADASDSTVVMRGKSRHLWVFPEELEMESLALPTIVGGCSLDLAGNDRKLISLSSEIRRFRWDEKGWVPSSSKIEPKCWVNLPRNFSPFNNHRRCPAIPSFTFIFTPNIRFSMARFGCAS